MSQTFTVTLSSKGQLTLPAEVRRALDLDQGARLQRTLRDDQTVEMERSLVTAALALLVDLLQFHVDQGRTVRRALDNFGDAMLIAAMEEAGADALYSFDRDYDHVPGIIRREP